MSFYDVLSAIDFKAHIAQCQRASGADVAQVLTSEQVDINAFLTLISHAASQGLEPIAQRAQAISLRQFGHSIVLYTPLYLANYCENVCLYCGFNAAHQTRRQRLDSAQIKAELQAIYNIGLRDVLLLTGESRKQTPPDYIAAAAKCAANQFKSVGIEVYPMETEEYQLLTENGVNYLTVYQETYCKQVYKDLHIKGPKADYRYRLATAERAAQAGMPQIGIGALLGLADPIYEAIALYYHLRYLEQHYPFVELSLSFPRLKEINAEMGFGKTEISERLLVQLMMAFRICFPRLGINISTRESAALRKHLIPLGVTKLSAGVVTGVGGHSEDAKSDEQFIIEDNSSVAQVEALIKTAGYQPIYSDWVGLSWRLSGL